MKNKIDFINEALVSCAARLDPNATVTESDALYEQLPPQIKQRYTYGDVVRSAKELSANIGVFKAGRRGHPSRIEWTAPVGSFRNGAASAVAPSEEQPELPTAHEEDGTPPQTPQKPIVAEPSAEMLEHTFALRPELRIALALPANLTQTEAERLAAFIRSLPF